MMSRGGMIGMRVQCGVHIMCIGIGQVRIVGHPIVVMIVRRRS